MNQRKLHIGIVLFFGWIGMTFSAQAQAIFLEDFEGTSALDYPDYAFPDNWAVYDEDGYVPNSATPITEGSFQLEDLGGNMVITSTSWFDPAGEGAADDWLVTPPVAIESGYRLLWKAAAPDADFPDGYEIHVTTSGNTPADFLNDGDIVYEVDAEPSTGLAQYEVDLSEYAGETVYIAFRNNSLDQFLLRFDDIGIYPPLQGVDPQFSAIDVPITYGWMPVFQATPIGPFEATVSALANESLTIDEVSVTVYIESIDENDQIIPIWSAESEVVASMASGDEETFTIDETWIPTTPGNYFMYYELTHNNLQLEENEANNISQFYYFNITDLDYSRNAFYILGGQPPLISEFQSFFYTPDITENNVTVDETPTGTFGQVLEFTGYSRIDSIAALIQNATGTINMDVYEFDAETNTIGEVLGSTVDFEDGTTGGVYTVLEMEEPLDLGPGHYFVGINDPDNGSMNVIIVSHYWEPGCCFVRENGGDWLNGNFVPVIETYLTELEGPATSVNFNSNNDMGFTYTFSGIANGLVDEWLWDFGDGNTSTEQNPTHTYTSGGDFDVTVTIIVEGEEYTSDVETISIECSLSVSVTPSPTQATVVLDEEGSMPYEFVLSDADGNELDSNDTGIFEGLELETAYSVNVTDADGCTDDATFSTTACSFDINDPSVIEQSVSFFDSFIDGNVPASYSWGNEGINAEADSPVAFDVAVGDYTITIADEFGCSKDVSFTVDTQTGVEDIAFVNDVSILPNPVTDAFVLSIDLKETAELTFAIYDISGKLMQENKVGMVANFNDKVDVSKLAAGVYVLKVNLNDEVLNYNLVVK